MQKKQQNDDLKIIKKLSFVLKNGASMDGINMDQKGYVKIDDLLQMSQFKSLNIEKIKEIVESNDKKIYQMIFENDEWLIRAIQGHLSADDKQELMKKISDPHQFETVVHGTFLKNWQQIRNEGLNKMGRDYIHFAMNLKNNNEVINGMRRICDVFIEVDMEKAMKDQIEFYLSENNVILTKGIDGDLHPKYFKKVIDRDGKIIYSNIDQIEQITLDYDFLLVLDFEANCLENQKLTVQEIIEFPVMIVDIKNCCQLKDHFHYYIKPRIHDQLSEFCTQLTGITQGQVNQGIELEDALKKFEKFLENLNILNNKFVIVTCGDWDLKTCLAEEAKAKNILVQSYLKKWINIKKVFSKQFRLKKRLNMMEMLEYLEIPHQGRHHSGIDDVRNIVEIALKMIELDKNSFKKQDESEIIE